MWLEHTGVFFCSEQNSWLLELLLLLTPQHELPLATSPQPQNQICYIFHIGSWALWVVDLPFPVFSPFNWNELTENQLDSWISTNTKLCVLSSMLPFIYLCIHVSLKLRPKTSMDEVNDPFPYRFGFCFFIFTLSLYYPFYYLKHRALFFLETWHIICIP